MEKEDERIIGITYNKDGEIFTKKFAKEVQLPGKILFQLWNERTENEIIAHNIYSGWYVLIEEDPQMSFDKTECVYGKLGRSVDELKNSAIRSIFSFETFTAQRQLLIPSLMGIYCDPDSPETTRLNALKICTLIQDYIDEKAKSAMIDQYNKYFVKGDSARCSAARI